VSDAASTRVDELVDALKRRRAPLPFEIGAYVALAACERLIEAPARVGGRDVHIHADGDVRVVGATAASDAESARALGALLAQLLVAAGPGVPPALLALVETRAPASLDAMRDGLARALMPLNRAASRRVLARLVRESIRDPRPSAGEVSETAASESALDDDLDALLGEAPPAPASASLSDTPAPSAASLAASLAALAAEEAAEDAAEIASAAPTSAEPVAVSGAAPSAVPSASAVAPAMPTEDPSPVRSASGTEESPPPAEPPDASASPTHPRLGRLSLEGIDETPRASGGGRARVVAAILLLAGLAALALFARPAWFGVGGESVPASSPPRDATAAPPADPLAQVADVAARGTVVVRCATPGAEILVFVGRGPVLTELLAQGVAHEFVVLADGKAASRGLVPADATWDTSPEGPRYELALQSGEADVPFDALELGPSRLPPNAGTPSEARGRVRVVTTPRGAKVYRVVGAGLSVRLEDARTDAAIELLVAAPGHVAERVVVGPSDWRDESGSRVATLDVTLTPRPAN
jgi:hypothetical protein